MAKLYSIQEITLKKWLDPYESELGNPLYTPDGDIYSASQMEIIRRILNPSQSDSSIE